MNAIALVLAAVELLAPSEAETVRLIPDVQRAVLTKETLAAREAVFAADRKGDRTLRTSKDWRTSLPLVLRWRVTEGEQGPWEVKIGKRTDLADARSWFIRKDRSEKKGKTEYEFTVPCANLEIATTYFWQVSSDITCGKFGHARQCDCKGRRLSRDSAVGRFVTEDLAPRWIAIEGSTARTVGNFRDLGGRIGLGGKRVRQGLVYRCQGLNDNSVDGRRPGKNRLSVEDVKMLTGEMGVRTDLDLRGPGETAGMTVSPLGEKVKFIHHSSQAYRSIFTPSGKEVMAKNFRVFCDEANYPIVFHCIGGADRTGSLAYVLNGVLGVKRAELETDWESTFYPRIPDQVHADDPDYWCRESHFNTGFAKYGDAATPWNERIVLYLKDCGVTDAEIAKFRAIMLR